MKAYLETAADPDMSQEEMEAYLLRVHEGKEDLNLERVEKFEFAGKIGTAAAEAYLDWLENKA